MGCCSSTDNNKSPPPKTAHLSNSTRECGNSKSPPPLQQEEEEVTVKEVVSEKTRSAKTGSLLTADGEPGLQNGAFFSKPAVANQSAAFSIPTPENNGDELRGTRRRSEQSTGQNRPEYDRGMDSGERSGRRSRFPVMYSDSWSWERGPDGSQSSRKTDGPLERVGSGLGERTRKVGEGKDSGGGNTWPPTSNELLENPLMSLECFIFL
ncbi:hypothetical protein ABFS82_08G143300 [Erythranthe guttata]|uniref:uncharacterized protein LOC105951612 n=1 Tax=Erythranthe guttata TaxID=4155 RepID=UPI00064DD897|nr:PREDICTED: uncharacterized protein LOC105951612 [Erythranthe guttata]|eukprot:XP_012830516.1 PREDICTED: uncharacterized protein LOC105951612 [Erythranthe guttata]